MSSINIWDHDGGSGDGVGGGGDDDDNDMMMMMMMMMAAKSMFVELKKMDTHLPPFLPIKSTQQNKARNMLTCLRHKQV